MADDDLATLFQAQSDESKERRARNRERGAGELERAGIAFTAKNNGAHLIVADRVDYWPGTGLWKDREVPHDGRGINALVDYMRSIT